MATENDALCNRPRPTKEAVFKRNEAASKEACFHFVVEKEDVRVA